VKESFYRKGHSNFAKYFSIDEDLVYCNDICGLTEELQLRYVPEQWRLFTDLSKAVLWKQHLSISLTHAVRMKETYGNIQGLMEKIWHETCQWNICADLKLWQS